MGSIPVQAWNFFFQACFFLNCLSWVHIAMIFICLKQLYIIDNYTILRNICNGAKLKYMYLLSEWRSSTVLSHYHFGRKTVYICKLLCRHALTRVLWLATFLFPCSRISLFLSLSILQGYQPKEPLRSVREVFWDLTQTVYFWTPMWVLPLQLCHI